MDSADQHYDAQVPGAFYSHADNFQAMENLTVPLITLYTPIIGWMVWLTIRTFKNDKEIAINTSSDITVKAQIFELKNDMTAKIDKLEKHVDSKFDQVNSKFERVFEMLRR